MTVQPLHQLANELEAHARRLAREARNHPSPAAHHAMIADHVNRAAALRTEDTSRPHPLVALQASGVIGPPRFQLPKPKRKKPKLVEDATHVRYRTEFVRRELAKLDARNHAAKRAAAEHSTPHLGG